MTKKPARARRSDGEQTHAAILDTAVRLASIEGLGGLSIGRLAQEVGVSKSGLYAHFGSKQDLEMSIWAAAREIFEREVIEPALAAPDGLARFEQLCERYLSYIERRVFPGGCFFAGMLAEFDARTGRGHDEIADDQREWNALLDATAAAAQAAGELDPTADLRQLVFDVAAAIQLANYYFVLFGNAGVIDQARSSIRAAISRSGGHPPHHAP
ncbi:TetR/AcrR family transcriptional regulator [Puerhibacterium sp. TATVAM-FAB25]|uniref:TetR/AcrR family transcriptional regulator n=1 Tax=Puerhibacterium sp. TATVAM-FAB25 TaxID=3093699 RepID=UPI003979CF03